MIPRLTTKTVVGQRTYNFGFDYLARDFVKVEINGKLLEYDKEYTVNDKTITLITAPTEVLPLYIYRDTSTIPLVEWQDSSIMTAKDLNLQQTQTAHISEELDYNSKEAKTTLKQAIDVNSSVTEKAEEVKRNTAKVAEDTTTVNLKATTVNSQSTQVSQDKTKVEELTRTNETLKQDTNVIKEEAKAVRNEINEKAKSVQQNTDLSTSNKQAIEEALAECREIKKYVKDISGGEYYTKTEIDKLIAREATGAVANLVGQAPKTLDTLQELAKALGNDPNFATTISSKIAEKTTLAQVYPVGSIYISITSTNPKVLFGFGTWEAIDQGRMLLSQGTNYSAGSTGGRAEVTLTIKELPAHSHYGSTTQAGGHSHGSSTNNAGGHSHSANLNFTKSYTNSGGNLATTQGNLIVVNGKTERIPISVDGAGGHTHSVNINSAGDHSHSIRSDGEGKAFSILPPYLSVYIWKRIS